MAGDMYSPADFGGAGRPGGPELGKKAAVAAAVMVAVLAAKAGAGRVNGVCGEYGSKWQEKTVAGDVTKVIGRADRRTHSPP